MKSNFFLFKLQKLHNTPRNSPEIIIEKYMGEVKVS